MKIEVAGLGVMLAAVARPHGDGPFPSVLLLHGSHGFAREYVELAGELARDGLLAVCWFSGTNGGDGGRFVILIACPDAPPMPMAASPKRCGRSARWFRRCVQSLEYARIGSRCLMARKPDPE